MEYRMRTGSLKLLVLGVTVIFFLSCKDKPGTTGGSDIVSNPDEMDGRTSANIKAGMDKLMLANGKLNDTITLLKPAIVNYFYTQHEFSNTWSESEQWLTAADSLFYFIEHSREYGLFPSDYHFKHLQSLRNKLADSIQRNNAVLWTHADILLTDAYMQLVNHLKNGRMSLVPDSLAMKTDTALAEGFYKESLDKALSSKTIALTLQAVEPKHRGYQQLRGAIKSFLDSNDLKQYSYVVYPGKDSIATLKQLQKRLAEAGYIDYKGKLADSAVLAGAIKKYQDAKGLKVNGKPSASLVSALNNTAYNKFVRIAITLDRYKQMPAKMPVSYVWVNLPGYYLEVWDHDTLALQSKVIVGKAATRTPLLNSVIENFITYPTWTPPASIVNKDILPAVKRNPGYLARRGFYVVDSKGNKVNPYSVNWSRYTAGSLPYRIRQYEGDNNSLGVLKFNFDNPFAVYLHDTNQRYLFSKSSRSLSHGCVRVQEWEQLANFLARNDTIRIDSVPFVYHPDTLKSWIKNRESHRVNLSRKIPVYLRYFSCEGRNGKVLFFDDIYGEDKALREKYFASK
jgi:L,D-transpeptidase YcbB